ncbi:MAG: aconitase family protein [Bacteroidota bacterium]
MKGRKKAEHVTAWVVPGSHIVEQQIKDEGILDILLEAGFQLRQPGCSACLAMNDDKIPAGKYAVSTSNRNFEGRQGPGAKNDAGKSIGGSSGGGNGGGDGSEGVDCRVMSRESGAFAGCKKQEVEIINHKQRWLTISLQS